MKMASTTTLMATGDALETWAAGDLTFNLFSANHSEIMVPPAEMPLVRPPVVSARRRLIWGFHYRPVWQESPEMEFPVVTIDNGTESDHLQEVLHGLRCALAAELRTGQYRLAELDRVRRLVEQADAVDSAWGEIFPLLSGEVDPWPLINRFRRLPADLARAVDGGLIDLRTAEAIPEEFAVLLGRFLPVFQPLSFSNRRQALRMAAEILRGGGDGDLLLQELSQLSQQEILPVLRRRRYPTLTNLERRFESLRRTALSGTGVTLSPPNNFEGDHFQVSFTFRTGTELRSRLQAAERLEDKMDELLDLLF